MSSGPQIVFTSDQSVILPGSGQTYQFAAHVEGAGHRRLAEPLTWRSTNPAVVTVDSSGDASAQSSLGSATILVSAPGAQEQAAQVTVAAPGPHTVLVADHEVVSEGSGTVTLKHDATTGGIVAGDILVSGNRAGLLDRVVTVARSSGNSSTLTFGVARASLVEAFPNLSIRAESASTPFVVHYGSDGVATVSLPGSPATTSVGNRGVRSLAASSGPARQVGPRGSLPSLLSDPLARSGASTATTAPSTKGGTGGKKTVHGCTSSFSHGARVTLEGPSFSVDASAHLIALLNATKAGTYFVLAIQARIPVVVKTGAIVVSASGKESVTCNWTLSSVTLPTPLFLGPIEVNGNFKLSAGVDLSGTLGAQMTVAGPTVSDTAALYDGIAYNSATGWSSLHNNGQSGVKVSPVSTGFRASLSVTMSPFLRTDFGVSGVLGNCDIDVCVTALQADLAFGQATGVLRFDLATPLDDLSPDYTGPRWSAGLQLTAGPEVKLSGALPTMLGWIGLTLPSKQWSLLDLKVPLLSSPSISVKIQGGSQPGSHATLRATVPSLYDGDVTEFVLDNDNGTAGRVVATSTATGGVASASWTVPAGGLTSHKLEALLVAPPFGSLLPYASSASAPSSPVGQGNSSSAGSGSSQWSAPVAVDPQGGALTAVQCTSSTFCMAVDARGRAYTFDGRAWSSPHQVTGGSSLYALSCAASNFCLAGSGNGSVYTYDGTSWSSGQPVDPGQTLDIYSLSCPTTTSCVAVGEAGSGLSYAFNGSAWSQFSSFSDTTEGTDAGFLMVAVSCASQGHCVEVDGGGNAYVLSQGAWSGPVAADPIGGGFQSISCPSTTFCVATDFAGNAVTYKDGHWSTPLTLDPFGVGKGSELGSGGVSTVYNETLSVKCRSTTSCIAFDAAGNVLTYQDGNWSAPIPADPTGAELTGISCPTASFCMAVDSTGHALSDAPG